MLSHRIQPNNPARRRAAAVAAVLSLTLALAGCNWFYQSNFPSYVPLIQNQVDVSDRFPYDPAAEFRVEVMNGGTGDYVIIFSAGPSNGERVAIYDENLEEKFFRDGGTTPVGFSFNAPVVIDDTPNLYVGDLAFGPGLSGPSVLGTGTALDGIDTIHEFSTGNYYSFRPQNTNTLQITTANPVESSIAGPPAPDVTTNLAADVEQIDAAMDVEANVAGIAGYDRTTNLVGGMVTSFTTFAIPATLATAAGGFEFFVDVGYAQTLSITADGVVLESDQDGRQLIYYDFAGNRGDSVDISSRGDSAYAFSAAGTHFYLLLADEGKLIKANTWW